MRYKTEQEDFWRGSFGDEYVERNKSNELLASNIYLFSKVLGRTIDVNSVIEFGCNIGMNLKAIKTLKPSIHCEGIEINHKAATILKKDDFFEGNIEVYEDSLLEIQLDKKYDMTLIKGVMIHINPNELDTIYSKLYEYSSKYICIAEYYNPSPVSISYRGNEDRLFKRDFVGEFMDKYPDVKLIDYGFAYHRDNNYPQDDITWFLLRK